jgi:2'-5' RNA ligase
VTPKPSRARVFVAVVPPAPVLDAVEEVAAAVSEQLPVTAKRTTRPQWHLTLAFLGWTDIDAVAEALTPFALRPGRLALGGLGAFPSPRRAQVVWLGVAAGAEWLAQAAAAVGALVRPLGHEPERRPYHGHLTLARLRAPGDVREVVATPCEPGPPFVAGEIVLFESVLRRTGAQYRAHARFAL